MKFITITRKVPGHSYNATKKVDGKGWINPNIEFKGVDILNLPSADELLELCGEKSALYLAEGYNNDMFESLRDPFDKYIPDDMDEERAKALRQAMVAFVKATGKTADEAAKLLVNMTGIRG